MTNKREYVSAIMRSKDNGIILQLRDDNPSIADPNCLSLFAGAIEKGETRIEALRREIQEETELNIQHADFLFSFEMDDPKADITRISHVYYIDDVDVRDITIHEGQGYRIVHSKQDLDRFAYAPISKAILQRWFDEFDPEQRISLKS